MQVHHKDIKPGRVTLSGTVITHVEQGESGIVFSLSDGRRITNRADDTWDVLPETITAATDPAKRIAAALLDANDGDADVAEEAVHEWSEDGFRPADFNEATNRVLLGIKNEGVAEQVLTALAALNRPSPANSTVVALGVAAQNAQEVEERKTLVLAFDVTGWTEEQISDLVAECSAQGEENDAHPHTFPAEAVYDHEATITVFDALQVGLGL